MKETYSKTEGHVTIEKLEKLGLIGCKSNLIKYDNVFDFKNGYVIVEKNDKLGLFDTKNNNIVIDIKYDDIRYLDGGSIVLERGGTY